MQMEMTTAKVHYLKEPEGWGEGSGGEEYVEGVGMLFRGVYSVDCRFSHH